MITAHMVVKNEDRFVWYAISAVLPFVDRFLIFDTGSSDQTVKFIRRFNDKKIEFRQVDISQPSDIAKYRDKQIKMTKTDWLWIVDGDEIYSHDLCQEVKNIISADGTKLEGVVVGRYDLLGDIYHYQDESVGAYDLLGRTGHLALRLINKKSINGLHVAGNYPYEEYFDENEIDVIFHPKEKFRFTQGKLFHTMYLPRSTQGANLPDTYHRRKWKIELGHKFGDNTKYPEVFAMERPSDIADVTEKRSLFYGIAACFMTPLKKLKRRIKI